MVVGDGDGGQTVTQHILSKVGAPSARNWFTTINEKKKKRIVTYK